MKWIGICLLLVGLLLSSTMPVLAATSVNITITVQGRVLDAPGGFTLTYVSDYEIGISWTVPEDADEVMVRAAYGRVPEDITDGYEDYRTELKRRLRR